jgi:regulatory protein
VKPRKSEKPKLDFEGLKNYAYRTLTARPLSTNELRTKLKAKAADPADIERIVTGLQEYNALNDEHFAQHFGSMRKENRGFGAGRVLRDLRLRQVAAPLAEKTVAQIYQGQDERELILAYLARKYRGKDTRDMKEFLADPKNLNSAFRRLRTAGFSAGKSIDVLKNYSSLAAEIPDDEDDA